MVGAGFSRAASRHADGVTKPPLWRDFAKSLAAQLDPSDSDLPFSDPLRLAEQYRSYFGDAALHDLIRAQIHDGALHIGSLHEDLLRLPWSEVLTTNWDTLLERASESLHERAYSVVSRESDLARMRSPRIVKLHGTIGVTDQYIVAQEDYRRYPEKYAAFVNFARQVFIENELCLLGFSGDDPNFIQWAGWVRDRLGNLARRIYLVGAFNLPASARRFLESINVAAIDLWDAVAEIDDHNLKHQRATELFLQALQRHKPKEEYEWTPTRLKRQHAGNDENVRMYKEPAFGALLLKGHLETLARDRETYPGWLTCPPDIRWLLKSQISSPFPNVDIIASLDGASRATLLYEIAWRHDTAWEPVPPWLRKEFNAVADPALPCGISKRQQLEMALFLAKLARRDNDSVEFEKWAAVISEHAIHFPDSRAEIAYQRAVLALERLDYASVPSLVDAIRGEDPVWKLKRASILCELLQYEEGDRLISNAYKQLLEQSRQAPNSVRVRSRLAWARWLFVNSDRSRRDQRVDGSVGKEWRCDPIDQFDHVNDEIAGQRERFLKRAYSVEPLFPTGHYQDNASDGADVDAPTSYVLTCLADAVGLPLRLKDVDILARDVRGIITSTPSSNSMSRFVMAIRSAGSDSNEVVKQVFSRIALARYERETVEDLATRIEAAIGFWRSRTISGLHGSPSQASRLLRVLMEVLARITVRLPVSRAVDTFRLGLSLANDPSLRDFPLFEAMGHLLEYPLKCIPEEQRGELLVDVLSFPLANEMGFDDIRRDYRWPNPVIEDVFARIPGPRLDARIQELIVHARQGSPAQTATLLRLLPLVQGGILTSAELKGLASAVWGEDCDYQSLPDTGLFLNALHVLPAPDKDAATEVLARTLFDVNAEPFLTRAHLLAVSGVADRKGSPLLPTPEQAIACFDRIVSWRPVVSHGSDDAERREQDSLIAAMGEVLTFSVVPALSKESRNHTRYERLLSFQQELYVSEAMGAFPYFCHLGDDVIEEIESRIVKGLQARESSAVGWAAHALHTWRGLAASGSVPAPHERLVARMVYLIEAGKEVGLHSLLWYVHEMLNVGGLPDSLIEVLGESIAHIFDEADYANVDPAGQEAVTAPIVRCNCATVAGDLMAVSPSDALSRLIDKAKQDPLPEVRFAVLNPSLAGN
ncbi:SIR2-like domain-containing protein [Paraburkholderia steynii]|uniref:SIR2-like domain-containing protein n=2 Tax=Paraburkholderia steynii TaxID=1245441 RepID=A0A7Z7FLY7_9BURK|nr:SIR2-like domain-containing protein [Paraburkholderia steynii]